MPNRGVPSATSGFTRRNEWRRELGGGVPYLKAKTALVLLRRPRLRGVPIAGGANWLRAGEGIRGGEPALYHPYTYGPRPRRIIMNKIFLLYSLSSLNKNLSPNPKPEALNPKLDQVPAEALELEPTRPLRTASWKGPPGIVWDMNPETGSSLGFRGLGFRGLGFRA